VTGSTEVAMDSIMDTFDAVGSAGCSTSVVAERIPIMNKRQEVICVELSLGKVSRKHTGK